VPCLYCQGVGGWMKPSVVCVVISSRRSRSLAVYIFLYICQWHLGGQFSHVGHILFLVVCTHTHSHSVCCLTSLLTYLAPSCICLLLLCISKILFLTSIVCPCCGFCNRKLDVTFNKCTCSVCTVFLLVCCVTVVDFNCLPCPM